jgi:hypothetical protein
VRIASVCKKGSGDVNLAANNRDGVAPVGLD